MTAQFIKNTCVKALEMNWAMTQLAKCPPHKCKDLIWNPNTHVKSGAWWHPPVFPALGLGNGDEERQILDIHWSAS